MPLYQRIVRDVLTPLALWRRGDTAQLRFQREFERTQFLVDPLATTISTNADRAYNLGFLNTKPDIKGMIDLTLLNGDIQEVKRAEPAQFNRTFYRINRIRVAGITNTLQHTDDDPYRGDREMTVCEMEQQVASAQLEQDRIHREAHWAVSADLHRIAGLVPPPSPPPPLSPGEGAATPVAPPGGVCRVWQGVIAWLLPKVAEAQTPGTLRPGSPPNAMPQVTPGAGIGEEVRIKGALQRAAGYQVEIQKKFAIATACLVFALLGIPVALRFPRGGAGMVIGTSVVVFAIYYIGLIGGEDLGDRLILSPFMAMWLPNVICGVAGLAGLWLVRREGGLARGGGAVDWGAVREMVRGWLGRGARAA